MRTSITLILERKRTLYALVSFGAVASFLLSRLAQTAGQSNRFFSRHSLSPIDLFFFSTGLLMNFQ